MNLGLWWQIQEEQQRAEWSRPCPMPGCTGRIYFDPAKADMSEGPPFPALYGTCGECGCHAAHAVDWDYDIWLRKDDEEGAIEVVEPGVLPEEE